MPLVTIGQQPTFTDEKATFEALSLPNTDFRRAVFLPLDARGAITAAQQPDASVTATTTTFQKLGFQAQTPDLAIVSIAQTFYPGWKASIDGQSAKLWRANGAFQALQVPAGTHHIELVYKDTAFRLGAAISVLGLVTCVVLWSKAGHAGSQFRPSTPPA